MASFETNTDFLFNSVQQISLVLAAEFILKRDPEKPKLKSDFENKIVETRLILNQVFDTGQNFQ